MYITISVNQLIHLLNCSTTLTTTSNPEYETLDEP